MNARATILVPVDLAAASCGNTAPAGDDEGDEEEEEE